MASYTVTFTEESSNPIPLHLVSREHNLSQYENNLGAEQHDQQPQNQLNPVNFIHTSVDEGDLVTISSGTDTIVNIIRASSTTPLFGSSTIILGRGSMGSDFDFRTSINSMSMKNSSNPSVFKKATTIKPLNNVLLDQAITRAATNDVALHSLDVSNNVMFGVHDGILRDMTADKLTPTTLTYNVEGNFIRSQSHTFHSFSTNVDQDDSTILKLSDSFIMDTPGCVVIHPQERHDVRTYLCFDDKFVDRLFSSETLGSHVHQVQSANLFNPSDMQKICTQVLQGFNPFGNIHSLVYDASSYVRSNLRCSRMMEIFSSSHVEDTTECGIMYGTFICSKNDNSVYCGSGELSVRCVGNGTDFKIHAKTDPALTTVHFHIHEDGYMAVYIVVKRRSCHITTAVGHAITGNDLLNRGRNLRLHSSVSTPRLSGKSPLKRTLYDEQGDSIYDRLGHNISNGFGIDLNLSGTLVFNRGNHGILSNNISEWLTSTSITDSISIAGPTVSPTFYASYPDVLDTILNQMDSSTLFSTSSIGSQNVDVPRSDINLCILTTLATRLIDSSPSFKDIYKSISTTTIKRRSRTISDDPFLSGKVLASIMFSLMSTRTDAFNNIYLLGKNIVQINQPNFSDEVFNYALSTITAQLYCICCSAGSVCNMGVGGGGQYATHERKRLDSCSKFKCVPFNLRGPPDSNPFSTHGGGFNVWACTREIIDLLVKDYKVRTFCQSNINFEICGGYIASLNNRPADVNVNDIFSSSFIVFDRFDRLSSFDPLISEMITVCNNHFSHHLNNTRTNMYMIQIPECRITCLIKSCDLKRTTMIHIGSTPRISSLKPTETNVMMGKDDVLITAPSGQSSSVSGFIRGTINSFKVNSSL